MFDRWMITAIATGGGFVIYGFICVVVVRDWRMATHGETQTR